MAGEDRPIKDFTRERRRKHATMRMMGMQPGKVNRKLAKEYEVTEKRIENDWSDRANWLPKVFDFEDAEAVVETLVAEKMMIKKELWKQHDQAESPEVKRRIMKQINGMTDSVLEILQDLGRARKEPMKHELDLATVSDETGEMIDEVLREIQEEIEEDTEEPGQG